MALFEGISKLLLCVLKILQCKKIVSAQIQYMSVLRLGNSVLYRRLVLTNAYSRR